MSEDSGQGTFDETVRPLSYNRILVLIVLTALAGAVFGAIYATPRFGLGILLGGAISVANFIWLGRTLGLVIGAVAAGETSQFLTVKYFARYSALAAVLVLVYLTNIVPLVAVLLGAAAVGPAVVAEALIRIVGSFINPKGL